MVSINILITPAPDCPTETTTLPPEKPTRATLEYVVLMAGPYGLDHKAFSHKIHIEMAHISGEDALDFAEFHAKGQPCMRASPLTKRYGWAAHYDTEGKLALLDPASDKFKALAEDKSLVQKPAMRSKKA